MPSELPKNFEKITIQSVSSKMYSFERHMWHFIRSTTITHTLTMIYTSFLSYHIFVIQQKIKNLDIMISHHKILIMIYFNTNKN